MNWTFRVRGEPVTLTILDDVAAVRPTNELLEAKLLPEAVPQLFGEAVGVEALVDIAGRAAGPDGSVFRNAGWHFVHPAQDVAFAAETRSSTSNATAVNQVYASESGDLMIGTDLATVQLPPEMTEYQIAETLRSDGLEIVYRLGFAPNLFEVRLPQGRPYAEMIDELQARTDRYVFAEPSLLETITPRMKPPDVDLNKQWQHDKPPVNGEIRSFGINSLDAWDITRGKGPDRPVRIAIIDIGMQISHPEFKDGIIGGGFFAPGNGNPATPDFFPYQPGMSDFPDDDHGTFCLGMAGAKMNNGGHGCGSAPDADLIAIVCANDQTGTQTTLARSIDFAVNPKAFHDEAEPKGGTDIISCSLKTNGVLKDVFKLAVDATQQGRNGLGIPIFWAVANEPKQITDTDVCSHPSVIAVGRSDRIGNVADCGFGPALAFLAPGMAVFSTRSDSLFNISDGTSFATPLAAGVAALVLAIKPDLTASEVANLLRESCEPLGQGHQDKRGHGVLNAANAVAKAKAL